MLRRIPASNCKLTGRTRVIRSNYKKRRGNIRELFFKCETSAHMHTPRVFFVGIKKRAGRPFMSGCPFLSASITVPCHPALSAFPVNNPTWEFCPSAADSVTTGWNNPLASNGAYQTMSSGDHRFALTRSSSRV